MKYSKYLYLIICVVAMAFVSCREPEATRIQIVCTSDVHGNLFPIDFLTGDSVHGSLARVSSYLKEQRQKGAEVIYIDNGDMLQGTPATYCYNTYAVGYTHVAAEALNYLQCDAVVLGNNDIEPGGPTYRRYIDDLNCQPIGGNILYDDIETSFLPPYTLIEREGMRIALLGLTTPAIPHWIPEALYPGIQFVDMEQSAERWMRHLRDNVKPDMVIGLFHSGFEGGIVTDNYAENATRAIAEHVPGFDAIFYGHDHRARIVEVVNVAGDTVLLLNPGKDALHVATIDIVQPEKGSASLSASLVDMNAYMPDEEYLKTFAPQIERIERYVNRTLGTSSHSTTTDEALYGPSALVDFMHQMQLDASGADISFATSSVADGILPEGEVTVRDIYRLYPYENTLYVLMLSGREVKDYLEFSYDRWIAHWGDPDFLPKYDSAAGVIYEVDATQPMGKRVDIKAMADGTPFSMDARYMVAMNSYRAHGGDGLLTEGVGIGHEELLHRIVYTTTADLRFQMINRVDMHKTLSPAPIHHWRFISEGNPKD